MSAEKLNIDGVEYVRSDLLPMSGDIKIVVLDRGYVYVGRVEIENDFVVISNAKNIRRYGTTKGIGELCNGPTSKTQLDNYGTVKAPIRALIHFIEVNQEKWKNI